MRIEKIVLDTIFRCYCASSVRVDGKLKLIMASEEIDGVCYAYSGENFETREVVWEKAGGAMAFVEIPGTNGEFLAVQNFFPGFNSAGAKIVWGKYIDGRWDVRDFISVPYVHRFDILVSEGKKYFVAATLCTSKREREDWADPGKILVGELPASRDQKMELTVLKDFLLKNHGYWRGTFDGSPASYITCDSGIYVVIPPKGEAGWELRQLLAGQYSEVAAFDLDGDGVDELVTISPFHGNDLRILKKEDERRYATAYRYPNEIDFAHALWAGELLGKPTAVFGVRRKSCELGYIRFDGEKYRETIIEKGAGTSNVAIVHDDGRELLLAANHTKNEAAVYILTE